MAYRYNKKKFKLKPLAYVMIIITVILLVLLGFFIVKNLNDDKDTSSNISDISSNMSNASTETSSKDTSSQNTSSQNPSSQNTSSKDTSSKVTSSVPLDEGSPTFDPNVLPDGKRTDFNLILLNKQNNLSKDLTFTKKKFNTQFIDARIASAYEKMCAAAKKEGITLYLRSGYRSFNEQTNNYNASIDRKIKSGMTREAAIVETEKYYARPGQSEHHTGLALDIITPEYHNNVYTLDERFAKTDAYKWLEKNSVNYGFALRYPKDKVAITEINYEPWHYRFVGVDHAKYMKAHNLCFEEYYKLIED